MDKAVFLGYTEEKTEADNMYDVVALGELLIDFALKGSDEAGYPSFAANPGGAPTNFLAALSAFGCKTAFIGKVGCDTFGRKLAETLEKQGIDIRGLVMAKDVFTTLAFVTIDEKGGRDFSFARKPGADMMLRRDELELSLIDEARVFHFGTLSLTDEPARSATCAAVDYARSQGKLISYDPNLRAPLWGSLDEAREQILWGLSKADIVKISDNEVDFLWGLSPEEGLEKILTDFGAKLVYVTCGGEGCIFGNGKVKGRVPALSGVKPVDTTGAGDIFGGSAMYALLKTGKQPEELELCELENIAAFACAAAGLSTERYGGISSVPALADVEEKLRIRVKILKTLH